MFPQLIEILEQTSVAFGRNIQYDQAIDTDQHLCGSINQKKNIYYLQVHMEQTQNESSPTL